MSNKLNETNGTLMFYEVHHFFLSEANLIWFCLKSIACNEEESKVLQKEILSICHLPTERMQRIHEKCKSEWTNDLILHLNLLS